MSLSFFVVTGGKGGWSEKGCHVNNEQSTDTLTVCECDHLTNFAMIMVRLILISFLAT